MKNPRNIFAKIEENLTFRRLMRNMEIHDQQEISSDVLVFAKKYPERFFNNDNCMGLLTGMLYEAGPNSRKAIEQFKKFAELFPLQSHSNLRMLGAIWNLQHQSDSSPSDTQIMRAHDKAINLSVEIIRHALVAIDEGELGYQDFVRSPFMRMMHDVSAFDIKGKISTELRKLFESPKVNPRFVASEPMIREFFFLDKNMFGRNYPFEGFEDCRKYSHLSEEQITNLYLESEELLGNLVPKGLDGLASIGL